jgi:hypothetical protein
VPTPSLSRARIEPTSFARPTIGQFSITGAP